MIGRLEELSYTRAIRIVHAVMRALSHSRDAVPATDTEAGAFAQAILDEIAAVEGAPIRLLSPAARARYGELLEQVARRLFEAERKIPEAEARTLLRKLAESPVRLG